MRLCCDRSLLQPAEIRARRFHHILDHGALLRGRLRSGLISIQPEAIDDRRFSRSPTNRRILAHLLSVCGFQVRSPAIALAFGPDAGAMKLAVRGGRCVALLSETKASGTAFDKVACFCALLRRA